MWGSQMTCTNRLRKVFERVFSTLSFFFALFKGKDGPYPYSLVRCLLLCAKQNIAVHSGKMGRCSTSEWGPEIKLFPTAVLKKR